MKIGLMLLVAAWAIGAAAAEPTSFETYSVVFADVRAAEEAARAIVGDEGSVTVDEPNHRLLVVTTSERHAQLAGMMQKLNVPPRNVRIEVRFKGASLEEDSGAGLNVEGGIARDPGLSHTTLRIKPRVVNETTRTSTDVTQTLLVASGREGMLHVGEEVPYLEWLMGCAFQWGYVRSQIAWQQVGSYLVVQPTVVGDGPLVRIRLTPELSGRVDGSPFRTRFARVATEVVVQDGQAFQIGGLDQDREFYSRFLVGSERGGTQGALEITLTPRILGPRATDH
jgi:type II secretory pathway component GspD/PulD (secretin)